MNILFPSPVFSLCRLIDCPKLSDLRQQLRSKIGDAFNNIAVMLGGKPHGNQDKAKGWTINRDVLNAVLDSAEASQRFWPTVSEGSQNRDRGRRDHHRP